MKIAAYVDASGAATGFYEKGEIRLYRQISGSWEVCKKIALEVDVERGLAETKETFFAAMSQLEDCRVFIVREFKGLFHALLMEELGFHTWKSEGTMLEQLDNVVEQEKAYVAELEKQAAANAGKPAAKSGGHGSCGGGCSSPRQSALPGEETDVCAMRSEVPPPVPVGDPADGHYIVNLAQILEDNQALNSREILIPVLEDKTIKKLEIVCDHVPRWFYNELRNLKLKAGPQLFDEISGGITIMVTQQ